MEELKKSIESIARAIDHTGNRMARIEAVMEQWQINIERFYNKDLAPLVKAVSDNQKAIADMQLELAKLKTQITIWGSLGVIVFSGIINYIMKQF